MSKADLEINRAVRKALVRHWLDLGRLSVRSSMGRLSIRGSLERIEGVREELTSNLVDALFAQMRRIPGVKRIQADITNWTCDGGRWHSVDEDGSRNQASGSEIDEKPSGTFDVDRELGGR